MSKHAFYQYISNLHFTINILQKHSEVNALIVHYSCMLQQFIWQINKLS